MTEDSGLPTTPTICFPKSRGPPPADARYVAQLAATSMIRVLRFTQHFTPGNVIAWWNDVVAMIEVVLSSSKLDCYVVFASLSLLERYAKSTEKPVHTLDTYRLFISSLMVAAKIICPRNPVPWSCVLGDSFMKESVIWMEREFLITVSWDIWMLEIVDEVWGAGRKGEPNVGRKRASALSWVSSATSKSVDSDTKDTITNSSSLFPTPLTLSPLKDGFPVPLPTRRRTTSSLWEAYMADRSVPVPYLVSSDASQRLAEDSSAPSPPLSKMSKTQSVLTNSRRLRTRVSQIFKQKRFSV
ncbi:hypothetical protein DFP72DRAFT_877706 [Ephemerocybe angulata]|uniref:Cyclin N-terminal domain-containing protein n=1 Tax=Ephemerocybe angulata TaxID=980116 RepID=A0A8H6IAN2_9AGAR|nr:hypothetical protein DFP72DRAFT_877706 [Tulosesus angulatus]